MIVKELVRGVFKLSHVRLDLSFFMGEAAGLCRKFGY